MKFIYSFLLTLALQVSSYGATYYVSNAGNDANDGLSTSTPWRTIAKVNAGSFSPGDNILFKKGDMWREQLTVSSSGAAGKPITFGAYGTGARPIINGGDVITSWTDAGSNRWYVNNPLVTGRAMVVIGGMVFSEVDSLVKVTSPGTYFLDQSANPDRVYVYSTVNPAELGAELASREFCVVGTDVGARHHIDIIGLECRLAGDAGVFMYSNPNGSFKGNWVVDDCSFFACRLFACAAVNHHNNDTFKNSSADHCGNGFYAEIADNISIRNCRTSNGIHFVIPPGTTDGHGFGGYMAKNFLVERCISTNDSDGINVDCGGLTANYTLRYNRIYNPAAGHNCIGLGSQGPATVGQVYYNLMVNGDYSAISSFTPNAGITYLYNNTIYKAASADSEGTVYLTYASNYVLKNNLVVSDGGDSQTLYLFPLTGLPLSDYNDFYRTNSSGSLYLFQYLTQRYATLAAWQAGVGLDTHSLYADPLFVDPASDWSLQPGSPCIDAGVDVGLTKDIRGNPIVGAPDIGAYEYGSDGAKIPAQSGL